MQSPQDIPRRTSGYRGRRAQLSRASHEDMLLLFDTLDADPEPEESEPVAAERKAEPHQAERIEQDLAVLTLGEASLTIAVRPDAPRGSDDHEVLPLFERAWALQDDLTRRIERGRHHRQALDQMLDLTEDCAHVSGTELSSPAAAPTEPAESALDDPSPVADTTGEPREPDKPVDQPAATQPAAPTHRTSITDLMKCAREGADPPFSWKRCLLTAAAASFVGCSLLWWAIY